MEQGEMLKTIHDFLDYVERLRKENDNLRTELRCAELRLARLDAELQEQPNSECRWISVEEEKPLNGELVVVMTDENARYMQTYWNGFTSNVAYWLRLPDLTETKKIKQS